MSQIEASFDPIAVHIGNRLKAKRKSNKWSQKYLASKVGLTFQQIQKYESGTNKISSTTLFRLANALEVPVTYFYQGLQDVTQDICSQVGELPDGMEMLRTILEIKNPESRKSLLLMAKTLASVQS